MALSILPPFQGLVPGSFEYRSFIKEALLRIRWIDLKWIDRQQAFWQLASRAEVVRKALEFLKEQRSQLLPKERGDAMTISLEYKKRDFALLLLDSGPVEDPPSYENLMQIAKLGDQEILNRLLQSHATTKSHFICAAEMAAKWHHWDVARALIIQADLTASDFERGTTAYECFLTCAARHGDQEIMGKLWPKGENDDRLQARMLLSAVGGGKDQWEVVTFILDLGPIDPGTRCSVVKEAASLGLGKCIDALLPEHGLLSQRDCVRAAHAATEKGHWPVARSLLLYGGIRISGEVPRDIFSYSDIFYWKFPDLYGFLIQAAAQNDLEILARLTPTKPEELAKLFRGCILANATKHLHIEALQFALGQGSINKFDRGEGVYFAALHGSQTLLDILLASGPISDLRRNEAKRAAVFRGHQEIAACLSQDLTS